MMEIAIIVLWSLLVAVAGFAAGWDSAVYAIRKRVAQIESE